MVYQLGITPDWFQDIDTLFEAVSIIITFLIGATVYKFYKLTAEKKYQWFSVSFFLIALAYVFKILTNIIVYNEETGTKILGQFTYTVKYIHEYYYFEIFGTLAFRFVMLLGLFGLYYLICKCQDKKSIPIIVFLLFFTTIFSTVEYFAFHLTAALFLFFIVLQYCENCKKMKKDAWRITNPVFAFSVLLLSQLIFTLLFLTPKVYVVAEIVQLLGFLFLLYNYLLLIQGK